jgi:hypothetical protein
MNASVGDADATPGARPPEVLKGPAFAVEQLPKPRRARRELSGGAVFDDGAAVDHQDAIELEGASYVVRHEKHRRAPPLLSRVAREPLARRPIEAPKGLVEHHQSRPRLRRRERPREPHPLALAPREQRAARPRRGREAVFEVVEDADEVGRLGGLEKGAAGAAAGGVGDVLADRVVPELDARVGPRRGGAQAREAFAAKGLAVDEQLAARRPVEPEQQAHERRLAGPRRPDDGDVLARRHLEVDAGENRRVVCDDRHAPKAHGGPALGVAAGRPRRRGDRRRAIERLVTRDLEESGQREPLYGVGLGERHQRPDGRWHPEGPECEQDERPRGAPAHREGVKDRDQQRRADQPVRGLEAGLRARQGLARPAPACELVALLFAEGVLVPVQSDGPQAPQRVEKKGEQPRRVHVVARVELAQAGLREGEGEGERRPAREHGREVARVDPRDRRERHAQIADRARRGQRGRGQVARRAQAVRAVGEIRGGARADEVIVDSPQGEERRQAQPQLEEAAQRGDRQGGGRFEREEGEREGPRRRRCAEAPAERREEAGGVEGGAVNEHLEDGPDRQGHHAGEKGESDEPPVAAEQAAELRQERRWVVARRRAGRRWRGVGGSDGGRRAGRRRCGAGGGGRRGRAEAEGRRPRGPSLGGGEQDYPLGHDGPFVLGD